MRRLLIIGFLLGIITFGLTSSAVADVAQGREDLFTKDLDGNFTLENLNEANTEFMNAVVASPNDPEANLFYALTRILFLAKGPAFEAILDAFDVTEEGRDLADWTADLPTDPDGSTIIPPDSPTGQELQNFLTLVVLPEINAALTNLDIIESDFGLQLTTAETGEDYIIEVDYGDVLIYRSTLLAAKALIKLIEAYDMDIDIYQLAQKIKSGDFGYFRDLYTPHPGFLALADSGVTLQESRGFLLDSIDEYEAAALFINSETDSQYDDLISFEDEDECGGMDATSVSFSIVEDALSCALPADEPDHPDCEFWNVTATLALDGSLNISGTFCGEGGGEDGSIVGTLTRNSGSSDGDPITFDDFAGTWSGPITVDVGEDQLTGTADYTVNADGSGTISLVACSTEDEEEFLANLLKIKSSIEDSIAVAMGEDVEDEDENLLWVNFGEFFDDPLDLREYIPPYWVIDPYTKDLIPTLDFPDKTFSGVFPEGIFQQGLSIATVWGIHQTEPDTQLFLSWVDGIAPWDIAYFWLRGPDEFEYVIDPIYGNGSNYKFGTYYFTTSGMWEDGHYDFKLSADRDEEEEYNLYIPFTSNELPIVNRENALPANETYINDTTPTFTWDSVTDDLIDTLYYRVEIHPVSSDAPIYLSDFQIENSLELPDGILNADETYRWRVSTFDGHTGLAANNRSMSDWSLFHTGAPDEPIGILYAYGMHRDWPSTEREQTKFGIRVKGPATWDVTITITGPGAYNETIVDAGDLGSVWYEGGYDYSVNEYLPDGDYTITVTDLRESAGNAQVSAVKNLQLNVLPVPDTYHAIEDETYIETTTPTFSWSAVTGNVYYRLHIDDRHWLHVSYRSPHTQNTSATVPAGILKPNNFYSWRVEVFDADNFSDTKNRTLGYRRSFFVKESFGKYALNVSIVGQGSVHALPSDGPYDPGTEVQLTASADAGWEFAGWSGDLEGSNNPTTVTMNKDMNIIATFTAAQVTAYTLTVNTEGPGNVTLDPSGGSYTEGQTVTLTAAASEVGWVFEGWSGDLSGSNSPDTITMDGDKIVTAIFSSGNDIGDDGIPDSEEWGPDPSTPHDGNNDNTPDYQQDHVTTLKTSDKQDYVTLAVDDTMTIRNVAAVADPSAGQQDMPQAEQGETLEFPYGFFSFEIEGLAAGGSVDVELYLPAGTTANTYYKYGPKPGNLSDHWYEFLYGNGNDTGAEFESDKIILHFTDAKRGDDELTVDSTIIDDGGPAVRTTIGGGGNDDDDGGGGGGGGGGCFVQSLNQK